MSQESYGQKGELAMMAYRIPHPTLELTNGWYRLRTQVDEVLARATRRGVIHVGHKIFVSSASVCFQFLSLP